MVLKKNQTKSSKGIEVRNLDPRLPAYYRNPPQPKTQPMTEAVERSNNWTEDE
jgi:hypothetical protein